jgi:hypothetical protein
MNKQMSSCAHRDAALSECERMHFADPLAVFLLVSICHQVTKSRLMSEFSRQSSRDFLLDLRYPLQPRSHNVVVALHTPPWTQDLEQDGLAFPAFVVNALAAALDGHAQDRTVVWAVVLHIVRSAFCAFEP